MHFLIRHFIRLVILLFIMGFSSASISNSNNFSGNQGNGVGNTSPGNQGNGTPTAGKAGGSTHSGDSGAGVGVGSGVVGGGTSGVSVPPSTGGVITPNGPVSPNSAVKSTADSVGKNVDGKVTNTESVSKLIEGQVLSLPPANEKINNKLSPEEQVNVSTEKSLDKAINTKEAREATTVVKKGKEIIFEQGKGGEQKKDKVKEVKEDKCGGR